MAKRPSKLVEYLRQTVGLPQPLPPTKISLSTDGKNSISNSERDTIVKRLITEVQPTDRRNSMQAYGKYIRPMTQQIAALRLDNAAIEILAPEVKAAQTIVIPSIISPTDLRDGDIALQSTSKLVDQPTNDEISKLLDEHFNVQQKLSAKLPEWIHEALYGAGSKPLLVLPITELDAILNDPTAIASQTKVNYATEMLAFAEKIRGLDATSILGIADSAHVKSGGTARKPAKHLFDLDANKPAIESAFATVLEELAQESAITPINKDRAPYNLGNNFSADVTANMQTFADEAIENLGIVDNPDVLKSDKLNKNAKKADLTQRLITYYKAKPLITINSETKPSKGDPVVYELPPESVIPIFTPGSPTDHIGYFIAIDEFGNPIHVNAGDAPAIDMSDNRRTTPGALFKSFGLEKNYQLRSPQQKNEQSKLLVGIYQTIIESHLKGRLKDSGLDNVYIGATENIYRCMFARYMSARRTRLLFVPRDLMTYFCFKHNDDGTGRSKIEDIKFILSLKITLLICRMMASMNSAINRRKLNINFTDEMGDPVQYIELLKKEAIDKSVMNFTYDPSEITRTLAQRGLSIAVKGIPGAENFDVSSEPNEQRNIRPDDSLIDDLNNMMILGLDVPPSAMNLLSENEFSRSVATNNLFFSRRISAYQKIVCELIASHVQVYTQMSQTLHDRIRAILTSGTKEEQDASPNATDGTAEEKKVSINDKITDIIRNIIAVLPAPDVAPNKTEFEELDSMITSMTTAIEAIFDNDLGSVDENPMPMVRALIRSDIMRDYMRKIGVARDVTMPEFDTDFLKRVMDFKQRVLNLTKGIKDSSAKLLPQPVDDPSLGGAPPSDDSSLGGAPPLDDNEPTF